MLWRWKFAFCAVFELNLKILRVEGGPGCQDSTELPSWKVHWTCDWHSLIMRHDSKLCRAVSQLWQQTVGEKHCTRSPPNSRILMNFAIRIVLQFQLNIKTFFPFWLSFFCQAVHMNAQALSILCWLKCKHLVKHEQKMLNHEKLCSSKVSKSYLLVYWTASIRRRFCKKPGVYIFWCGTGRYSSHVASLNIFERLFVGIYRIMQNIV